MDTDQHFGVWRRWKAMDLDPYSKVNNQSFQTLNKQEHFHYRVECSHQRRNKPYLESTVNPSSCVSLRHVDLTVWLYLEIGFLEGMLKQVMSLCPNPIGRVSLYNEETWTWRHTQGGWYEEAQGKGGNGKPRKGTLDEISLLTDILLLHCQVSECVPMQTYWFSHFLIN